MHDVWNVGKDIELEHLSVVLEELLLGCDSTTTEFVLQVVLHDGVLLRDELSLSFDMPIITLLSFRPRLRFTNVLFF